MSERDVRLFELRELLARLAGDDALVSPETAEVSLLLRRAVDRLAAVDEAVDPLAPTLDLGAVAGNSPDAPEDPGEPADRPRYVLTRLLGAGGMGEVFSAHDQRLRREVAYKVQRADRCGPAAEARFVEEAQVAAQLQHPNIVPVHDLGLDADGRLYFTMKRVEGRSLAEVLRERSGEVAAGQASPREVLSGVLEVFRKVCDAVGYAHDRGVVHRDLKPANVMIGAFGEVLVMDWGLARLTRGGLEDSEAPVESDRMEEGGTETRVGAALGTPAYMAPEQTGLIDGEVGPWTDVYALGALLYELLTFTPPFVSGGSGDLLERVARGELQPPSSRARASTGDGPGPLVPADLEAVVLRAMARDPADRPADAQALSDEVRAWLEHRPLESFDYGPRQLLTMWLARNRRIVVGAGSVAALALVAGGLGLAKYVADVTSARDEAVLEAERARVAELRARLGEARAQAATADVFAAEERVFESRELYRAARATLAELGEPTLAVDLGLSLSYDRFGDPAWLLEDRSSRPASWIRALEDGTVVAGWMGGGVTRWAFPDGRVLASLPPPAAGSAVTALVRLDDRLRVLVQDPLAVRAIDLQDGSVTWETDLAPPWLERLSPPLDGPWAAVMGPSDTRVVLDVATGRPSPVSLPSSWQVWWLDDGGRGLATAGYDGPYLAFDASTGRTWTPPGPQYERWRRTPVGPCCWSSGPRRLLVRRRDCDTGEVLWSAAVRSVEEIVPGPDGNIWHLGEDAGGVQLLAAATGTPVARLAEVRSAETPRLSVDHNGQLVYRTAGPGRLLVWSLVGAGETRGLEPDGSQCSSMGLSPDGRLMACGDLSGGLQLWDLATGRSLWKVSTGAGFLLSTRFSPDGSEIATGGRGGVVEIHRTTDGAASGRIETGARSLMSLRWLQDGQLLVAPSERGVERWARGATHPIQRYEHHLGSVWHIDLLDAGTRALTTGFDKADASVQVIDVSSGAVLERYDGLGGLAYRAARSADGRRVAGAASDHFTLVWDSTTGEIVHRLEGHEGAVLSVAFSPDGRLLATGGFDQTVRLWDLQTGEELRILQHAGDVNDIAWHPDGRRILTVAEDGPVRIWDPGLAARFEEATRRLPALAARLRERPDDPEALVERARSWSLHRLHDLAVDDLLAAREAGGDVSPLELGRALWLADRLEEAARELADARGAGEAPEAYLDTCIGAIERALAARDQ